LLERPGQASIASMTDTIGLARAWPFRRDFSAAALQGLLLATLSPFDSCFRLAV